MIRKAKQNNVEWSLLSIYFQLLTMLSVDPINQVKSSIDINR